MCPIFESFHLANQFEFLKWEMEGQQNASTEQIYKTPMGGTDDEKSSSRSIPVRGKPSRTRANIRSGNTHIIKDFFERAENTPADNTVADERPWRSAKIRKFRNRVGNSNLEFVRPVIPGPQTLSDEQTLTL